MYRLSNRKKPLLGMVAFYSRMRTSPHSSPMLKVNCPIFQAIGPHPPPLLPSIPPSWSHTHTYVIKSLNKQKMTSAHRILLGQIQNKLIILVREYLYHWLVLNLKFFTEKIANNYLPQSTEPTQVSHKWGSSWLSWFFCLGLVKLF